MPAPHNLDPDAMTEAERLAKRRFEAGFAFETAAACVGCFGVGGHAPGCPTGQNGPPVYD